MSEATGAKQAVTTSITLPDCAAGLKWYENNLGAKVSSKFMSKDGEKVMHSSVVFPNKAVVFFTDHLAEYNSQSEMQYPSLSTGNPYSLCLLFSDEPSGDAFWNDRVKKAESVRIDKEFEFQFWGDKFGTFADPFGHVWNVMVFGKPPDSSADSSSSSESSKKRSLSDAKSTDDPSKDNNGSNEATLKRSKKTSSESSMTEGTSRFCWKDLRDRAMKTEWKAGEGEPYRSLGFFEMSSPVSCLAIEFKVGSQTGVTFNQACNDGFMKLLELAKTPESGLNGRLELAPVLAFSPESPAEMDPVRYSPSLMCRDGSSLEEWKSEWDGKAAGKGPKTQAEMKLSVHSIQEGKSFVALHLGSYAGMKDSWTRAISAVAESGHVCVPEQCFEAYFNSPKDTPESELRSTIHIGVRPKP